MSHRFRFLGRRLGPEQWELLPDEWHHLLKVLRLPVGSDVEIADGAGNVALARLSHAGKNEGELAIASENFTAAPAPASQVTLALGALKPQSADDLRRLFGRIAIAGTGEVAEQPDLLQSRLGAFGRQPLKPLLLRLPLHRLLLLAHLALLMVVQTSWCPVSPRRGGA